MSYSVPGAPQGLAPQDGSGHRRSGGLPADTRRAILCFGLVGLTLGMVLFALLRSPMKDDVAWLLWVAGQWLRGQELYVDLVEVNPPLIIWLSALPVMLAELLGLTAKQVALPMIAAGALGSAWMAAGLLRGVSPVFAQRPATFAAIACVLLVMPGVEFGQREHLLVIAVLPHLAVLIRMLEGLPVRPGLSIGTGILAGLGVALKPRYVLCLGAIELAGWLHRGFRIRLAPIAAGLAGLLYLASILYFVPAFVERAVPLALTLYGGTDTGLLALALESWLLLLGLGACLVLTWKTDRGGAASGVMLVLTAFAAAATVAMFLDGKNWFYHRIPALMAVTFALVFWCADVALRRRVLPRRNALLALALLPLALSVQQTSVRVYERLVLAVEPDTSTEVRLERLIRREKVRSYMAFSEWIGLGFPVVNNTNVTWASRFDSMWALRGEIWRSRQDGVAPDEWPIRHWVVQDFMEGCPDLVVVDRRGESLNYPAILSQANAGFAAVWARYRQIAVVDGLQVYRRQGEGCGDPAGMG
ncbi:hypothetical protein [Teichococcus cervicalis]|uniref:Glycosyltransferase RgtA/B/C/D-like domain-containing protein n=1 Tax=Pseudoroseomonas cervicalis ATCC 49957 TaxID=525371 RepID=D5RRH7_9PROT|nr:hypothetical protein [Pseudoroseomonas cervicalis]EFH10085.1 hypothetical protein HMPREF0731_3689 [Pseudoroseomonas cervicalis ATCC 49957]